jgi:hypothetical protein
MVPSTSDPDPLSGTTSVDFRKFVSGGYYLVRPTARPESFSTLLPATIVTLSSCIGEVGPGLWAVDWPGAPQNREAEAAKFGIPADRLPELVDWVSAVVAGRLVPGGSPTQDPGEVVPFGFSSLSAAREFYVRFIPGNEILILGSGLHESLLPSLDEQKHRDINRGFGLVERIHRRQAVAPGTVLGFEPLGFEAVSFHSWLCNDFPEEVNKKLGIQPGPNGLITDLADAIRVTEHIRQAEAEPAIWLPWLIVQYASTTPSDRPELR